MNALKKSLVVLSFVVTALASRAQSYMNYYITDAGGGESTVSWTVSGELATPTGAELTNTASYGSWSFVVPGLQGYTNYNYNVFSTLPNYQIFPVSGAGNLVNVTSNTTVPITGIGIGEITQYGQPIMTLGLLAATNGWYSNSLLYGSGFITGAGNKDYISMSVTSGSVTVPIPYTDFIPGTYSESTDDGSLPELKDGGLVTLSFPEATPEPGTMALGAAGATALLAFRRRK